MRTKAAYIACFSLLFAGHGAGVAQNASLLAHDGVTIDLEDLSTAKSRRLTEALRRRGALLTPIADESGHRVPQVTTDPAKLKEVLDRLVRDGTLNMADIPLLDTEERAAAFAMPDFLEELRSVSQIAGPNHAANTLSAQRSRELSACPDPICRGRVSARYDDVIAALAAQPPACDEAARNHADVVRAIRQTGLSLSLSVRLQAASKMADEACMAAPWDDGAPDVARTGGGPAGTGGALNATALLEMEGRPEPFCGGLFLSRTEVLTTLHCFNTPERYRALREGRVRVRQIGTSVKLPAQKESWAATAIALPAEPQVVREDIPLEEDAIRLSITGGPAALPRVTLAPASPPSKAFVPSYFSFSSDRRPAVSASEWASTPKWWKGIRWAKPGTCVVVDTAPRCFRMMCQTTQGYSGAPVFSLSPNPDGPLLFHGIVKGTEGGANVCRPQPMDFSTLGIVSPAP